MKHWRGVALAILLSACAHHAPTGIEKALAGNPLEFLEQAVVGPAGDGTYVVPTNQLIDPAGDTVLFAGRPVELALQPVAGNPVLAVLNRKDLVFLDAQTRQVLQTLPFPAGGASFSGLAWESPARVWASTSEKLIHCAERGADGQFSFVAKLELPGPEGKGNAVPGGMAVDAEARLLYVTLSRNNTLGVVDLGEQKLVQEIPVGVAPFGVLLHGQKAYVTNWGGRHPREGELTGPTSGTKILIDEAGIASSGSVSVVDLTARQVLAEVEVELHPCGMALSPQGDRLYVANANSDSVSVIDTATNAVAARWQTRPMETLPFGSAPNALAVSPDGAQLYVANGGNNCLAVLSTGDGSVQGLIPAGWYPGDVLLLNNGAQLCVANTKGVGSRAKDVDAVPMEIRERLQADLEAKKHNSHDHLGSISFIPVPDAKTLSDYTFQTATNMRLPQMHQVMNLEGVEERLAPVPTAPGEVSPIKHVIYVIKENRTYDQVFGDMPKGNGDPELCHFGYEVTPNHHALAEEFVLLDNFYCNGILSADGHQWATESFVTDYIEKSFGGFSRSYPYDGDDAMAYASSGFIWDHVLRKGLTFRCYGEMVQATITPDTASWADIYADYLNGTSNVKIEASTQVRGLENYICPTFVGFPGKVQDVYRMREFLKEFRKFEAQGNLPNFIVMLLPNDHTVGTRENMPTPRATVADNDLALGQLVEAVSNSKYWPQTAIFVVEDDPQAGLDHVDGHRTVALCISPYTKRGSVDSTHYNQSSMLRTMGLILGVGPMNQFDMAAQPMLACFQDEPVLTPYTLRPNQIPLDEMNPMIEKTSGLQRYYAMESMKMPLDDIDQADEGLFNRVLWHSVKGYDVPYPNLAQRAMLGEEDEDE